MNKRSILMISTLCTLAGASVAAAHPGAGGRFKQADANQDGVVTSQEMEAEALAHFSAVDTNKDGKLTPEERKAGHERRREEHFEELDANDNGALERSEIDRMPEAFFSKLDTDKNGALSPSELSAVGHGRLGHRHPGKGPKGDADGDSTLSKAEFLAKAKSRMAKLDENQDGKLTQEELRAHHGRGGHCEHGPEGSASAKPAPKVR